MADEPIILTHQIEPRIQEVHAGAEHPVPSKEQEQVADGIFSRGQEQAIAAVLNLQAGMVLAQHLARETFPRDEEEEEEDRKRRAKPDESPR